MKLFDNPWNTIFFAGFVVFYWIRHVFIERTKQEKKTLGRMDMLEKILLIGMVPGTLLLPLLYLFTPLLAFAAMYFLRIPREERMMSEKFGDQYGSYMRQTGRLFPRWK
jgi:protein-S-isoprenylcysteine O-methyltransferase Ste14